MYLRNPEFASYTNRREAGRLLADILRRSYGGRSDLLVLALPRGGVPIGVEIARGLDVPLDILLVRKLGVPGHDELAMGAIASGGVRVLNRSVLGHLGIEEDSIEAVTARERRELERRERSYRGERPQPSISARCVVLVDDGLATGSTMKAAAAAVRQGSPSRIVVAVPVAPPDTVEGLRREVEDVVCPLTPEPFGGVGAWYDDFRQVPDDEVRQLLEESWAQRDQAKKT